LKRLEDWWFAEEEKEIAHNIDVPIGERVSRYFKDLFSKDDLKESK